MFPSLGIQSSTISRIQIINYLIIYIAGGLKIPYQNLA